MGQEIMINDEWIKALADQERARQTRIAQFVKIAPAFIDALANKLRSDLELYHKEFPGQTTAINPEPQAGQIQILCTAYKPPIQATVVLKEFHQRVSCSYTNVDWLGVNWEEQLEVAEDGTLQLRGVPQDYTIESLSRKILIPALFPLLLNDPAIERFL
jgi:hypothetical protein